jgi:hypothetical protein
MVEFLVRSSGAANDVVSAREDERGALEARKEEEKSVMRAL